jgi:hypothetical protein
MPDQPYTHVLDLRHSVIHFHPRNLTVGNWNPQSSSREVPTFDILSTGSIQPAATCPSATAGNPEPNPGHNF